VDGHRSYGDEANAIVNTFKTVFQYPGTTYPIPSVNTYTHVVGFIRDTLVDLGNEAEANKAASLLIIHYGGHGDRDDRHARQERRSVWAA
jgi:hypothetical protein